MGKGILATPDLLDSGLIKNPENLNLEYLRGVLSIREKQVFVLDNSNYNKRHNFILAHELGHWKLPSHRALLFNCTQFDLRKNARDQLEREANFFASELGFMSNLFFEYLQGSPLSMKHIKFLSDTFEFSIEATLRQAVELEIRPCAFRSLVVNEKDEESFLRSKYIIYSNAFIEKYGKLNHRAVYPRNHVLAKIITDPMSSLFNEAIDTVKLGPEETPLKVDVWKNKWNVFVLYQPES